MRRLCAWGPCVGRAVVPSPPAPLSRPGGRGGETACLAWRPCGGPGDGPFLAVGLRMHWNFQKFFPRVISRFSRFLAGSLTG